MPEVLASNASKLAVSTPIEVNLSAIIKQCASRKASIGITFTNKRGINSLFSGVCAAYKSSRGMSMEEPLDKPTVEKIQDAITTFWKIQAQHLLSYGEVDKYTYDKPAAIFDEKVTQVNDIRVKATMVASKSLKGNKDERLNTLFLRNQATERLASMSKEVWRYDATQIATQKLKIAALEKYLQILTPDGPVDLSK